MNRLPLVEIMEALDVAEEKKSSEIAQEEFQPIN